MKNEKNKRLWNKNKTKIKINQGYSIKLLNELKNKIRVNDLMNDEMVMMMIV